MRRAAVAGALVVAAPLVAFWVYHAPEAALARFVTYGPSPGRIVAECHLTDPLILSGRRVVPLVLEAIEDRAFPRRRYAIGFLGNGGYPEAVPGLRRILEDDAEDELFRGDALDALDEIDRELAARLARDYVGRDDSLGRVARDVANGTPRRGPRRTWFDALFHRSS